MKLSLHFFSFAILFLLSSPASSQDWDCSKPENLPQQGMNICAFQDFQNADVDLNDFYKIAREELRSIDGYLAKDMQGGAIALRDAQRAWVTYRDRSCEAEGFVARGGSLEPLLVSSCKARLTRQRTEDLRSAFEFN